ncbi:MAG: potassium transporter TrkH [Nitrospinae bacterium CG11_big_fil_rev_8_21_14_0_20_56_8]|nr:MAG: potassium transporter TrkH [Nitrospinae bacterium CG11_big_fil_rev_8_21_14_0_20_56_8]
MINYRFLGYILGLLLLVLSVGMLIPAAVDWGYDNPDWKTFMMSSIATALSGFILYVNNLGFEKPLSTRDSFLLTTLTWILISLYSAFPLFFSSLNLDVTDAFFESISGLTTTGSTVLTGLDRMPPGILVWRALLQWIGGVGIIVITIVIMPNLGIGGMRLFYSESSDRSEKPLSRFKTMAAWIALVYLVLTGLCALAYKLAGMTTFDAVIHSMTTLSTGGYASKDKSFAFFANPTLEWICTFFMVMGSLPFILYIRALMGERALLLKDEQVRLFLSFLACTIIFFAVWLCMAHEVSFGEAIRHSAFNIVSIVTTTGYATTDYNEWGSISIMGFFIFTFMGGCAGSTAGGIKIFRLKVMFTLIRIQMSRLLHPRAVLVPKLNQQPISDETVQSVLTFFSFYLFSFCFLALGLSLLGLDFITSASGAVTAISNVGPGLGPIIGPAGNFASLPDAAKWLLAFGMLVGRLELFTVLILFTPRFWRE